MTLDELIEAACVLRKSSPLGGQTVVHMTELEVEPKPVTGLTLETDDDGAIICVECFEGEQ